MNLTGGSHDGLQFTPYQLPISTTKCDLTLTMSEDGDTLSGRFEFRKDLFHKSTIRSLSIAFQTLIDSITANPLQSVNRLNLLGNEHRLRLQELNKSEAASPGTACLHQLFEQQASLTPTARAVVHAEGELSYEELNKHSDQLAERLQQLGVGPETRATHQAGQGRETHHAPGVVGRHPCDSRLVLPAGGPKEGFQGLCEKGGVQLDTAKVRFPREVEEHPRDVTCSPERAPGLGLDAAQQRGPRSVPRKVQSRG